jgi:hypothetical protein
MLIVVCADHVPVSESRSGVVPTLAAVTMQEFVEIEAVHAAPVERMQVQALGALGVLTDVSRNCVVPEPDGFVVQTEPVTVVDEGIVMSCTSRAEEAPPLSSAQVPPIGAPATVATTGLAPVRLHGLVAAVPVLIVFDCKA